MLYPGHSWKGALSLWEAIAIASPEQGALFLWSCLLNVAFYTEYGNTEHLFFWIMTLSQE